MTESRRKNLSVLLGCSLVGLGALLSGTILEATIFPVGTITGTSRRAPALLACRIVIVAIGAYLLARRPRITAVHLSAIAVGCGAAGIMGALFLQVLYVPPPIVSGWRGFAPKGEQNQLGFRGREIAYSPQDFVVVLLGDSQVEGMAMAFDAMPERRLEAHLEALGLTTRVFSIGAGGYGQDQELLALQEYFEKYRADLVVLWQTPTNDIWNNVFKTHMSGRNPKPTFSLDASKRLTGPSESLGQTLAGSPIVAIAMWQRAFGLPWRDKSWERTLPDPYEPLDHHEGPVRTEWQDRWNGNLGRMRDENLDSEKSHLAVGLRPRSARMQYGIDLTRALIQRIQDLAATNHGRLVALHVDTHEHASESDEVYLLNKKYYRVSDRQFQENWNDVTAGFDTESIPVTVKDWRVGAEDGHLNVLATDQVMKDLAQRLRSRITERRSASVTVQ